MWHCIAHLHLGANNDTPYHVSAPKRKQAFSDAKKHIELKYRFVKNLHTSHKKKPENKNNKVDEYEPNSKELSLDKSLPTSREEDYTDIGTNGDSLHYPNVTKEQLDNELKQYMDKLSNNEDVLSNISETSNENSNK